jgi:hypothetical protein
MIINNQKGSLMIQALISIAIFGAITGSIVRLMQMQNNLSVKTTEEFEMVYFISEVRNILANPKACKASFYNKNSRNDRTTREIYQHITDDKDNDYTFPAFETGQIFKDTKEYSLKVNEIYLLNHNPEVHPKAGTTGLHFSIEFLNKRNNRVKILDRVVKLFITQDSSQKVQSCYSLKGIGLGKEIVGKAEGFSRKSDQSGHFIDKKKLLIGTNEQTADVNIGGAIRLASSDIRCTNESSNSIRYNKELNRFEICNEKTQVWNNINTTAPLEETPTELNVALPLKYSSTRKSFKICALVENDSQATSCQLSRLEDNRWQIQLENSSASYANCKAICKN